MLILSLAVKHKLSGAALADVLKVIGMHLPAGGTPKAYKSLYQLLKRVSAMEGDFSSATVSHKLCGKCRAYLPENQPCQNAECQRIDTRVADEVFVELPVDLQIKAMFKSK